MKKILITGPESSGKSFLAKELSKHLNGVLVTEYVRQYLDGKTNYNQKDLDCIAKGQFEAEQSGMIKGTDYLVCDTGIEVVKIWSSEKYGNVSSLVSDLYQKSEYDLVLLCKPNIPWVPDELRENPLDRDRLFKLYKEEMRIKYPKVALIDADFGKRLPQALQLLSQFNI